MSTLAIALLAANVNTPTVIESSLLAYSRMDKGAAQVRVVSRSPYKNDTSNYKVKFIRPDQIELEVMEPARDGNPAFSRIYTIRGKEFYGYDPTAGEYLTREVEAEGLLAAKFGSVAGGVDDAVQYLLDPRGMEPFLLPLKSLPDWRVVIKNGKIFCVRSIKSKGQKSEVNLKFDFKSRLLESAKLVADVSTMSIDYRYEKPPVGILFVPPKTAQRVDSFYQRPVQPKYSSKVARNVAESAQKAYNRLKHVAYTVEDSDGSIKTWLSGTKMKEQGPNYEWAYDGTTLYLVDHVQKTFYEGRASIKKVNEILAQAGARIDPLLKSIANKRNPMSMLFAADLTVSHVGKMENGGKTISILEGKTKGARIQAGIYQDSKLLANLHVENLDMKGKVLAESDRRVTYTSVGKPLDKNLFVLKAPQGYRVEDVEQLAAAARNASNVH